MRTVILVVLVALVAVATIVVSCGEQPGQREFDRGVRELQGGNHVRAKTWFEKSINKRPGSVENARAYNYLGIVCTKLDQLEAAVDAFEDSRRLNPDLVQPTYNLAVLMYRGGDLFRAMVLLEEASLVDLGDTRAMELLGHIYRENKDWAKARRVLQAARERTSESASVLTSLALVELQAEGPNKGVELLMQALEKNPGYAPALYNLAVIHQTSLSNPAQARAFYKQFLQTHNEGPQAEQARKALAAEAEQAVQLAEKIPVKPTPAKKPPEAKPAAAPVAPPAKAAPPAEAPPAKPAPAAAAVEPARPAVAAGTVEALIATARAEADRGQPRQALNLLLQAAARAEKENKPGLREQALKLGVELCFDQARAHYAYGRLLAEKGDHRQALASFKQAVVLDANWAPAQLALARSAMENGEYDAALVALKKGLELDRQNADAAWDLARLYDEKMELPDRAGQAYREFKGQFPGDPRVLEADKRMRALQPAPALEEARPAPEKKPSAAGSLPAPQLVRQAATQAVGQDRRLNIEKPRVRDTRAAVQAYNRGTVYQARQDWDRAVYYYRRAAESDDTFVQAFYNLGTVYRARGDLDLAKDAYIHALRLRPDMVNARYNLALAYWDLREYAGAEEQAENVLKQQPDNAGAHYLLGLVLSLNQQTEGRAAEHYRKFLALAPDDPAAGNVRKWLETNAPVRR